MSAIQNYVDSLEWNIEMDQPPIIDNEIVQFRQWISEQGRMTYYALVIVGVRKLRNLLPEIKGIKVSGGDVAIGKAFALASLGVNIEKNIGQLQKYGSMTQVVGGARSLRNLNAIELLSLIKDHSFCSYLRRTSTETDETFQQEAIQVASERYEKLFGEHCAIDGTGASEQ